MKKYLLVTILLTIFLTSCLPYNISKNVEFNDSFKTIYLVGDELPNFEDSFVNTGSTEVTFEVNIGDLDMNAAGVYLIEIKVYETGNRDNELIIELQILINDSIL